MSPRPKGSYGPYNINREPTKCPICGQTCVGPTGLRIHTSMTHRGGKK